MVNVSATKGRISLLEILHGIAETTLLMYLDDLVCNQLYVCA